MTEGSFEELYAATYRRLLKQLVLVTGDRGDAEDVLQEAYGRAAVRWTHLRDYDRPEAWVRRVALHLAADAGRRARRAAATLLRLSPRPPQVELSADSLDLANGGCDLEQELRPTASSRKGSTSPSRTRSSCIRVR